MKKFMFLHVGFEKPTPEIMQQWQSWFDLIKDRQIDQQGFAAGREISHSGVSELAWDRNCLTGYNIIEAQDLDEAEQLAKGNPFITSIRIYEIR